MKKSRIALLFKVILTILFIYNAISFIRFNRSYSLNQKDILGTGTVSRVIKNENYQTLYINDDNSAKVKAYYNGNKVINVGDIVSYSYKISDINTLNNFDTFNYRAYLKGLNVSNVIKIENIKIIKKDNRYFLLRRINNLVNNTKSRAYLSMFLLTDKSFVDQDIKDAYSYNGISHLLCVSGFHISFLLLFIKKILYKFLKKEWLTVSILALISMLYLYLTSFSLPLYRAVLFYFFTYFISRYNLKINKYLVFFLILNISVLNNTNLLFLSSFWYTYIIAFFLISINHSNRNILTTSFYCFLISIPINIYFNYSFNILSLILNILFSIVICYIVYPLCFVSLYIGVFDNILFEITRISEKLNLYLSNINYFNIVIGKVSIYIVIVLYALLFIYFKSKKKTLLFVLVLFLILCKFQHVLDNNIYVYYLDVGQGDMSVIAGKYMKNVIVIDTGGLENNRLLSSNLMQFLHSRSITKIDSLILSHGDYDHMGEAINLVNNFKVEKVIFNCGEFNDLEKELIKVLDKKKIKYYSCIKELNIDIDKLYFLQTKEYDNENDNSNVIYTELNNYKFMFMGDASVTTEKEILDKYNLSDIDVLKVGHHGSKTSSSKEFINEINPKYSIISVGKNNRYGHPNKEVLENLKDSKIYRTDEDGSIMFNIKSNKLKVETCNP